MKFLIIFWLVLCICAGFYLVMSWLNFSWNPAEWNWILFGDIFWWAFKSIVALIIGGLCLVAGISSFGKYPD